MNRATTITVAALAASLAASGCATESSVNNASDDMELATSDAGTPSTGAAAGDPIPNDPAAGDQAAPSGTTPAPSGDTTPMDSTTPDSTTPDSTTPDSTTPAETGSNPPVAAEDCVTGQTAGNTVLLIGDSYLDFNGKAYGAELQRLAREAGALGANDAYEDRSFSGTQFVGNPITDLFLPPIPTQYANANNGDGHIKTVIMDGGGNDVLVGNRSCIDTQAPPANQSCVDTIENALAAGAELLAQMERDGVENVLYFFYPHLPGGGSGGDKQLSNDTIDYAYPLARAMCDNAALNCVFLDTRGLFSDAPSEFQDGIHPIVSNTQKISRHTWEAMEANCIAQ